MEPKNLWFEVGNKCLERALELLNSETATTAETVATVKGLVDTAVELDYRMKLFESGHVKIR